jgi:hypothetical protein
VGEALFLRMLGNLADRVAFGEIGTATFLEAIEHMSGRDLGTFAERFVYGTGIPSIFYRYEIGPDPDGGFVVRGTGEQMLAGPAESRVVSTPEGGWDAVRSREDRLDPDLAEITAGYEVELVAAAGSERESGVVTLRGGRPGFELRLDREPRGLMLDPAGRVPAFFFNETLAPKSAMRQRARLLAALGERDAALELFAAALEARFFGGSAAEVAVDAGRLEFNVRRENRAILLDIAETRLDAGEIEAAAVALEEAGGARPETGPDPEERRSVFLEARLALRRGQGKAAHELLTRYARGRYRDRAGRSPAYGAPWREIAEDERWDGQAWALVALAAHLAGREDECRAALYEAATRLARVSALVELHGKKSR